MSEELAIWREHSLWAYGVSDRYAVAIRRSNLSEHDHDYWTGVVGEFVRKHNLQLLLEKQIPDVASPDGNLISVWSTPGIRQGIASGEISQEDFTAELDSIDYEISTKYGVTEDMKPKLRFW
ncbi:hypothetical protein LT350_14350 [Mycolicibacterium smegmatis]|uniref:hypothetical protein n=1 Tax=Mycolicibacterium smegmatis TaxID=1772 RepID=UPI001E57D8EF|nr:hypothetical protein [Mycolicibacterium smegmatis]UGU34006.1 hypothetical protein LT350_14350 [Mycolicibacterium smegmatis]